MDKPVLSVVIIDSRSKQHPKWVEECIDSVKNQSLSNLELIVLDNRERFFTAGRMRNQGLQEATADWVLFVDDDDFISPDYCTSLAVFIQGAPDDVKICSTYSTFFKETTKEKTRKEKAPLGAYNREYFLEHPFKEHLNKYVDVNALEDLKKDGFRMTTCPYHFGYYYRSHDGQISGKKHVTGVNNKDILFIAKQNNFIEPYIERFEKDGYSVSRQTFRPDSIGDNVKVVWCEWGDEQAIAVSKLDIKAKRILRIHSYEAYTDFMDQMNWEAWDLIIFVGEHIKDYLETRVGKLEQAVVIKNAIDLDKFKFSVDKEDNSIAFIGNFKDEKGVQLLMHTAREFPTYNFYAKGQVYHKDIQQYMKERKPDNLTWIDPSDEISEFLSDKKFIINTSRRESQCLSLLEGMACGCKPLVYNWIGSDKSYPNEYIWNTYKELRVLLRKTKPEEYRQYVEILHDVNTAYVEFKGVVDELIK